MCCADGLGCAPWVFWQFFWVVARPWWSLGRACPKARVGSPPRGAPKDRGPRTPWTPCPVLRAFNNKQLLIK